MNTTIFPQRIKELRLSMNKTQKEFADYLNIPQPTLSAYENGKNNPTLDVVIEISNKCNISIDWLCGRNNISGLNDLSDLLRFIYDLYEADKIKCETIIHDHIENNLDIEEENEIDDKNRWWVQLKFYGNDKNNPLNADICKLIKRVYEQHSDLENYGLSKENYDSEKEKWLNYYSGYLIEKEVYPNLTREERMKKHIEYLQKTHQM